MAILNTGIVKPASDPYSIDNSCRFQTSYMRRTNTAGSAGTNFTISFWFKRGSISSGSGWTNPYTQYLYNGDTSYAAGNQDIAFLIQNNTIAIISGSPEVNVWTSHKYSDLSAWYHVVGEIDTTESTDSDRVKLYINGTRYPVASMTGASGSGSPVWPAEDATLDNTASGFMQTVGGRETGVDTLLMEFDGYIADFHFVDGISLDADSFGERGDYGEWRPKKYSGSHGTTGYHLDFSNAGQAQIAQATGTVAASSTQVAAGGLSATIDGVTAQGAGASGRTTNMEYTAWIGKDWGVGNTKTITGWQHWGSTDDGTSHSGSNVNSCTITLYGNSTDDTSSATALGGLTGLNFREMGKMYEMLSGLTTTTAYRYHWLKLYAPNAVSYLFTAEFKFFEGTVSGLGIDAAGSNHFTTKSGLTSYDQVPDSPTNNFAIINALDGQIITGDVFAEGALSYKNTENAGSPMKRASFGMRGGKWYWEVLRVDAPGEQGATMGILPSPQGRPVGVTIGGTQIPGGFGIYSNGSISGLNNGGTINGTSTAQAQNDVLMWAWDGDTGKLWLGFNGTWRDGSGGTGNPATGAYPWANMSTYAGNTYSPAFQVHNNVEFRANFGQDSSFAGAISSGGNADDEGFGDFKYDVPAGFKALCSKNLPDCAVVPSEHFGIMLADEGAGARTFASHGIPAGAAFAPEMVWLKARDATQNHRLCDVIMGVENALKPNLGNLLSSEPQGITSFDADGFTVGSEGAYIDTTGDGMVFWNWKLGGTPTATNSAGAGATPTANSVKIDGVNLGSALAGSIPVLKLTANTLAGISVGTWTGSGANATIAHGLTKAPELVVVHSTTVADSWPLGSVQSLPSASMDFTDYLRRDSTAVVAAGTTIWNSLPPTATVINLGSSDASNKSSNTWRFEAYHSVEGYSKVGCYVGNQNADGSFIYCGFRPRYFFAKAINAGEYWHIIDSARDPRNLEGLRIRAEDTAVEAVTVETDFLSNGVKLTYGADLNSSSYTYIFMAFAEMPFKNAMAR